jgi:hypothetical protein
MTLCAVRYAVWLPSHTWKTLRYVALQLSTTAACNMSACASTALILHDVPISIACAVARHQVAASIACSAHVDRYYCLHASAQQFVC